MSVTKPTVGQSRGTWGATLNAALDDLDARLTAADEAFAPRPPQVSDLVAPYVIPHKGGLNVVPEHTAEAYRYALGQGFHILDVDCQTTSDGALVDLHNTTVDSITTATGNVSAQTAATVQLLDVDAGTWFAPAWPSTMRLNLVGDVLARYGTGACYSIEAKAASTAQVQKIVDLVVQHGLAENVVVQSANLGSLAPAVAAGIAANFITDTPDAATCLAAGVEYVTTSSTVADAVITAAVAGGLKVWVWNIANHYEADRAVSLGAVGIVADDPVYVRDHLDGTHAYRRTSDLFVSKTWYPGQALGVNDRGQFLGTNRHGWSSAGVNAAILEGAIGPITPTSYVISGTVTFDAVGSASSHAYLLFGAPDDRPYKDNVGGAGYVDGWKVAFQSNGVVQGYKTTRGGGAVSQGTVTFPAPSAGSTLAFTITVTPSTIAVKELSTNHTLTINDAAFRGGYVHRGQSGLGSALASSWSGLSVA